MLQSSLFVSFWRLPLPKHLSSVPESDRESIPDSSCIQEQIVNSILFGTTSSQTFSILKFSDNLSSTVENCQGEKRAACNMKGLVIDAVRIHVQSTPHRKMRFWSQWADGSIQVALLVHSLKTERYAQYRAIQDEPTNGTTTHERTLRRLKRQFWSEK